MDKMREELKYWKLETEDEEDEEDDEEKQIRALPLEQRFPIAFSKLQVINSSVLSVLVDSIHVFCYCSFTNNAIYPCGCINLFKRATDGM
jgi:hypothetical protein